MLLFAYSLLAQACCADCVHYPQRGRGRLCTNFFTIYIVSFLSIFNTCFHMAQCSCGPVSAVSINWLTLTFVLVQYDEFALQLRSLSSTFLSSSRSCLKYLTVCMLDGWVACWWQQSGVRCVRSIKPGCLWRPSAFLSCPCISSLPVSPFGVSAVWIAVAVGPPWNTESGRLCFLSLSFLSHIGLCHLSSIRPG